MSERRLDIGPGFVRAKECPDCLHTRCGEDCVCNCDAAHAEVEAAHYKGACETLRSEVARLTSERDAAIREAVEKAAVLMETRRDGWDRARYAADDPEHSAETNSDMRHAAQERFFEARDAALAIRRLLPTPAAVLSPALTQKARTAQARLVEVQESSTWVPDATPAAEPAPCGSYPDRDWQERIGTTCIKPKGHVGQCTDGGLFWVTPTPPARTDEGEVERLKEALRTIQGIRAEVARLTSERDAAVRETLETLEVTIHRALPASEAVLAVRQIIANRLAALPTSAAEPAPDPLRKLLGAIPDMPLTADTPPAATERCPDCGTETGKGLCAPWSPHPRVQCSRAPSAAPAEGKESRDE